MANNDDSILRHEENGVEYYTLKSNGESGMSQRGLARACGKDEKQIRRLIQDLRTNKAPKRLQRFVGKEITWGQFVGAKKGGTVIVYRADFCSVVIKHYAYLGSETAQDFDELTGTLGLTTFIQGKTGWLPSEYQSNKEERGKVSRLLSEPMVYEALYSKEMCDRAFAWFGCQFYWDFLYHWMTNDERAELERNNPAKQGRRNEYIHQWLTPIVRDRLEGHARLLLTMLVQARSKQDFLGMYQRVYGDGWQLDFNLQF